jgi:hypothetical protein
VTLSLPHNCTQWRHVRQWYHGHVWLRHHGAGPQFAQEDPPLQCRHGSSKAEATWAPPSRHQCRLLKVAQTTPRWHWRGILMVARLLKAAVVAPQGSDSVGWRCGILQSSTSAGSSKAMWAQAPPRRRGLLQGSAVAGSSRQRGLLQGNGCTGMGSSKAAVGWPDGGLESRPDGPRSGLGRFFIFEN